MASTARCVSVCVNLSSVSTLCVCVSVCEQEDGIKALSQLCSDFELSHTTSEWEELQQHTCLVCGRGCGASDWSAGLSVSKRDYDEVIYQSPCAAVTFVPAHRKWCNVTNG